MDYYFMVPCNILGNPKNELKLFSEMRLNLDIKFTHWQDLENSPYNTR